MSMPTCGPSCACAPGNSSPRWGWSGCRTRAWLQFAERAFPTNLVPNRDIGTQLFGDLFDGTLSYQVGAFDGAVDGASINNSTPTVDLNLGGRLFAHPFKNGEHGRAAWPRAGYRLHDRRSERHIDQCKSSRLPDARPAELLHLCHRGLCQRQSHQPVAAALLLQRPLRLVRRVRHGAADGDQEHQHPGCGQLGLAALCHLGAHRRGRILFRSHAAQSVRLACPQVGRVRHQRAGEPAHDRQRSVRRLDRHLARQSQRVGAQGDRRRHFDELVPEPQHQAAAHLRSDQFRGRCARAAKTRTTRRFSSRASRRTTEQARGGPERCAQPWGSAQRARSSGAKRTLSLRSMCVTRPSCTRISMDP